MGWMWSLCLGSNKTSRKQLRASGSRGRVSNDVTEVLRPPECLPEPIISSKAPACVEEYSEPRIGSYKSLLLPGPSKGAISNKSTNSCAQDADEKIIRRELGQSNEYEKEFGVNSKHNKGGDEEDRLREEVDELHLIPRHCDSKEFKLEVSSLRWAWNVTALRHHGAIHPKSGIPESTDVMRRYWNPAWGYALDAMPDSYNNQAEHQQGLTPTSRKSFSELLIEADSTGGDSSTTVKGPLALAATAAAAERAARNPSGVRIRRSSLGSHGHRMASAAGHGFSENLLPHQDYDNLPNLQRMIVDFPRLPTDGQQSRRPKIREISSGRSELKRPALDSSTIMSTGEGLDFEWARSSTSTDQADRRSKLCKDVMGSSNSPSSTFLIDVPGSSKTLSSIEKHADKINPPHESVHTIPLLQVGSRDSSFSHSETHVASGVAASKEGRLQWHKDTERLILHKSLALPRTTASQNGGRSSHKRFGKLFRSSSKKRSLSFGSRPFRRPLSPVPEALSLDESLWSRSNDHTDQTARSTDNIANHAKDLINANIQKLGMEFVNSTTSGKKTSSSLSTNRSTGSPSSPLSNHDEDRNSRPISPLISSSMVIPIATPDSSSWKHNFDVEHPREIGQWEAEKFRSYKHIGGIEILQPLRSSELTSSGYSQSGLVLSEELDLDLRTPETIAGGGSFLKFVGGRRSLGGSEMAELTSRSTSSRKNLQRNQENMLEQEGKESNDHGSIKQFEDWNSLRKSAIGKGYVASRTQLKDNYGAISGTTNKGGVVSRDEELENGSTTTSMQVRGRSASDSKTSTKTKSRNIYQDDTLAVNARDSEGNDCVEIKGKNGTTPLSDHYQKSPGRMDTNFQVLTPQRDPQVTPEVFISPKGCHKDLAFTRLLDINLEDRPIFGTIADHWEAASWSTKRQAWDGKGIPNSTNKYKEDQKVSFHATPFEERLAQALATQETVSPRKLLDVSATRNVHSETSLEAH